MPEIPAPRIRNRRWYALWVAVLATAALVTGMVPATASQGYRVEVFNENSSLCMSIPGDNVYAGQLIDQYHCGHYPDQYWYENPSSSHPGWYYFQPQQDDTLCATYVPGENYQLTLEPCGTDAANGNPSTMLFYPWVSGELQTWQGWAMSVPGARTDWSSPINIWPYGPYPDQFWQLPLI